MKINFGKKLIEAKRRKCDHVTGYIGRTDDPLVKLLNSSQLPDVEKKSDELFKQGFTVTIFPWCPVCGLALLRFTPTPQTPPPHINGASTR